MSTYTSSLGLEEITPGDQAGLWGNTTNNNLALIDQAIAGVTPISFAGLSSTVVTLSDLDGSVSSQARSSVLNITGSATGANTVVIPNKQKTYFVRNDTGQGVTFRTASPGAVVLVAAGYSIPIFCDGNNDVFTGFETPTAGTLNVPFGGTGSTSFTAGFVKSPGGTGNLTSSAAVNLASEVTGTLPVANGGTGVTGFTSGALVVGTGSTPLATIAGSAAGQVLTYNGSSWVPRASGLTPGSYTSTNITVNSEGLITAISTGSGGSGVASVAVTSPIVNNGTPTAPNIGISATPSFTTVTTSGNITATSGNINANTGSVGVGTGVTGLGHGLITGSSIQLYGVGTQSMFGNSGVFGWIINNTSSFAGGITEFRPGIDNFSTSGSNLFRWSAVWAVNGTIQTSDSRLKTNVTPSALGLNFISKLNPVSYKWIAGGKIEDGTTTPTQIGNTTMDLKNFKDRPGVRTHYGLIAQEVKQTLDELNVGDFAGWSLDDKDDPNSTQALNYGQFIAPLIKAVQELKAELDEAKAEIAALKAK